MLQFRDKSTTSNALSVSSLLHFSRAPILILLQAEGKERPASPPGEPEEEVKVVVKKEEAAKEVKEDPDPAKPEPVVLDGLSEECCLVHFFWIFFGL